MNRCWLESTAVNRSLISQADPLTYLAQTCDRTSEWANYFVVADMNRNIIGVFHKSLTEIITVKGLEPATSCVREQDVTTVPSRHMWETPWIEADLWSSDLSNSPNLLNSVKVQLHLGKTPW